MVTISRRFNVPLLTRIELYGARRGGAVEVRVEALVPRKPFRRRLHGLSVETLFARPAKSELASRRVPPMQIKRLKLPEQYADGGLTLGRQLDAGECEFTPI